MTVVPHELVAGVLSETPDLSVSLMPLRGRFSLRLMPEGTDPAGEVLGFRLPMRIGARQAAGSREVVCLGPDEWLVVCDDADRAVIEQGFATLAASVPHALVDLSDRELTVSVSGARATELLTLGWPRDPQSVAVGTARRTVFDGVTVVIWRDGETQWRLDVWRSFAPHVLDLLLTGCRELAAG